ncbi:MAG: FecR domain-containing protein [Elusimicrobia bacterium]|nr:FecR domain-containing protein [Elusimicrobiota bacterium]
MKTLGSVLAVLLCVSFAQSAEVRVTRGTAYVKKAQSARWAALRGKGRVEPGDSLRTGANSLARVRTKGGHTVYVQPKTTIESVSENGKDTQFKVLVGRIRAFVQKLRPANKFEVRTPVAVAAVRGTTFDMDVSEDTSSRLSVLEGAVNYRDLAGLAKEIEVLKGQTVLIPRGQAPRPPEMMPKDLMQGGGGARGAWAARDLCGEAAGRPAGRVPREGGGRAERGAVSTGARGGGRLRPARADRGVHPAPGAGQLRLRRRQPPRGGTNIFTLGRRCERPSSRATGRFKPFHEAEFGCCRPPELVRPQHPLPGLERPRLLPGMALRGNTQGIYLLGARNFSGSCF